MTNEAQKRQQFICACIDGNLNKVQGMLNEGFKVNRGDGDLYTALHRVCENWESNKKHLPILELLISHGADVNADNPATDGWTPLHLAAWAGKAEACILLLKHGARPNYPDWYGQIPFQVAEYAGHEDAANVLKQASQQQKLRSNL